MKLKNFYGKLTEDEEKKKKILLDDEMKSDEKICEQDGEGCVVCQKEVCECGIEEQEQLDDEVDEQNTTANIAGYNMPLGAGRPDIANQNKLPKDYYKQKDKKAIKALDSGPNPDRTYKKYKWVWEEKRKNKKMNEQNSFLPQYPYILYGRGKTYGITKDGKINGSPNWLVMGITKKWNAGFKKLINWEKIKELLQTTQEIKGYFYDKDHGTIRGWSGEYNGKLPVVTIYKNSHYKSNKINEQIGSQERTIDTYVMLGDKKIPIKMKLINMGFGLGRIEISYKNKLIMGSQIKYEAGILKFSNLTAGMYRFKEN